MSLHTVDHIRSNLHSELAGDIYFHSSIDGLLGVLVHIVDVGSSTNQADEDVDALQAGSGDLTLDGLCTQGLQLLRPSRRRVASEEFDFANLRGTVLW